MLAAVITSVANTATPESFSVPTPGSESMRTALRLSPASTSLKPKSGALNT